MKMLRKCIVCLQKATIWTGNVIKPDGEHIIAGWCRNHNPKEAAPNFANIKGCYGGWLKQYGDEEEFQ